jgi:DNA repair exonuclease SbcCD ATPase subunit
MIDTMDKEIKNNLYKDILNSQSHNELLDCVKRTLELKERFSGLRLNKVNCTKEKIVNAFLGLYEKNKIIEKIIMDMGKEERGNKMNKNVIKKVIDIKSSTKTNTIGETAGNADKATEDLMDFSLREFINSINQLKDENEKLKVGVEKSNTEITKYKDKLEKNNTEITSLSDKLKTANSTIKEKNSLIADFSTRMDKIEKSLNGKVEGLEKEVKKVVPVVDKVKEVAEKNNSTLKEILVNVKEERKALSKLQGIESEIKDIENKVASKVIEEIKAFIENLDIYRREVCIDKSEQNQDLSDVASHIKGKEQTVTHKEYKQEVNHKEEVKHKEEDEAELSKMLDDIKSIIM